MWREEEERERRTIWPRGERKGHDYRTQVPPISLSLCFPFTFLSSIYFLPEHLFILLSLPLRKRHTLTHTQVERENSWRKKGEKKEGKRREESNHTHRATYDDMNVV